MTWFPDPRIQDAKVAGALSSLSKELLDREAQLESLLARIEALEGKKTFQDLTTRSGLTVGGALTAKGNATVAGTLDVTGNFTVNTNKFIVTASSGNFSSAGTGQVINTFTIYNSAFGTGTTSEAIFQLADKNCFRLQYISQDGSNNTATFRVNMRNPSTGAADMRMDVMESGRLILYTNAASPAANVSLHPSGFSYMQGGNVAIGGSTDNGFKLEVTGTAKVSSHATIGGTLGVTGVSTLAAVSATSISFGQSTLNFYQTDTLTVQLKDNSGATNVGTAKTWYITRIGNMVFLNITASTGTSTSSDLTVSVTAVNGVSTGGSPVLPSYMRPARAQRVPISTQDSGAYAWGMLDIQTSGALTIYKDASGPFSSWTSSGTKGVPVNHSTSWDTQ